MATPKGVSGNPKGRPKGVPNKVTGDMRDFIKEILDKNMTPKKVQKDLDSLDPKDRLMFMEKILPYVVPKLQSTELAVGLQGLRPEQIETLFDKVVYQLS